MSSPSRHVETGTFQIARTAGGSVVFLLPDTSADPRSPSQPHPDERSSRADQRARELQALLDRGEVKTRAEIANRLGVSRARVTQILGRLNGPQSVEGRR